MKQKSKRVLVLALAALFVIPFVLYNCESDDPVEKPEVKHKLLVNNIKNGDRFTFTDELTIEMTSEAPFKDFKIISNNKTLQEKPAVEGDFSVKIKASELGLGKQIVVFQYVNEEGKQKSDSRKILILSDITPEELKVKEIASFPHRSKSYTQGLEFYKGNLFEGTGQYKESIIAKVDVNTGELLKSEALNPDYFGEGITIFNDKLYQITWQKRKCIIRDPETLEQIGNEMEYFGEGWGLTHDSTHLIMSNGSNEITFRNPETLVEEKSIKVVDNDREINNLNELEYINGFIYANVYQTPFIVKIDPKTGKVLAHIDASNLDLKKNMGADVLNGIAHNNKTGKTYLTGKYWDKLYEVTFE